MNTNTSDENNASTVENNNTHSSDEENEQKRRFCKICYITAEDDSLDGNGAENDEEWVHPCKCKFLANKRNNKSAFQVLAQSNGFTADAFKSGSNRHLISSVTSAPCASETHFVCKNINL